MISFKVETRHEKVGEPVVSYYYAPRIDAQFSTETSDWSVSFLMLSTMVLGLQSMFAGDHIYLTIEFETRFGKQMFVYNQVVMRQDAELLKIALDLEAQA